MTTTGDLPANCQTNVPINWNFGSGELFVHDITHQTAPRLTVLLR